MQKIKFGRGRSEEKLNNAAGGDVFAVEGVNAPSKGEAAGKKEKRSKSSKEKGQKRSVKDLRNVFNRSNRSKKKNKDGADGQDGQSEGFSVNVRNTDPMLRIAEPLKKRKVSGILSAFLSSLVLAAVLSLFLISAGAPVVVPCVLAGVVTYVGITLVRTKMNERFRLITILITIVVMVAALVLLRKFIGNGLALIINGLFESSELVQAYVYDMYPVGSTGESSPTLCMCIAAAWCSALAGILTALPGEGWRGTINTVIFILAMIGYAYLGIIPSWAGAMPLIVVFLISAANGRLGSVWPLILAVLLVFGGITLLDPGESYTVSRANENLRDLFALKTALIQGLDSSSLEEEFEYPEDEEWTEEDE